MCTFFSHLQHWIVKLAVIGILMSHISVAIAARTGGDAVYRVGGWLTFGLDHAGVYDTSGGVYEIRGPFTKIQLSSWTTFLNGNSYIGEFTNPQITIGDRNNILGTCAQMDADPDINYTASAALYYESNPGVYISVDEITDIRCDGVVEYAYEWNNVWIWGKADPPDQSGTPTHFDISYTAYCDEHDNLGGDDPWFELSPKVQHGGSGEKWTQLRRPIAPVVTSVNSGNPVIGSDSRQWIPIGGSNFKSGFSATFRDVSNNITYPTITDPARLDFISSSQVRVFAGVGTAQSTWSVKIINPDGSESNEFQFSVISSTTSVPTVTTVSATNVTSSSVTLNGTISNDGGSSILERRFDWGMTPDGSGWTNWTNQVNISGSIFSYNLTGLNPSTTYYFRAWAKNSTGWGMGNILPFTTQSQTETVSIPSTPSGPTNGAVETSYTYTTGGATSNLGHAVEYRFNWGDGTYSSWSSSTTASKSWSSSGTYVVKAQARCATHTNVVSSDSSGLSVAITITQTETVSTPSTPSGPTNGAVETSYTYTTGGATSNLGHAVEYQFNWGDGTYSSWSSSTTASKSWSSSGTYVVKTQARCATHTNVVSSDSAGLSVAITITQTETVSTPSTPSGPTNGAVGTSYTYTTGGATSNLGHAVEYRFNWGDGTYSSWSSSTTASKSWSSSGTYVVKAQARCATHNNVMSTESSGLSVTQSETPPTPTPTPTPVTPKITAGGWHTATLKSDGTVWAWGGNWIGQLGDGSTTKRTMPVQVSGLNGVTAIASQGEHTLALKSDRTVLAWGNNWDGQLGDGSTTGRTTPVQVSGLSGVTAISPGYNYSIALKSNGTVWTWGDNQYGQLGDGTTIDRTTPVQVTGLSNVTAIAGGYDHGIALKSDGTVWTWGRNDAGQLGDGTTIQKTTPVQVNGLSGIIAVAGGQDHALALKSDGTVWSWGKNSIGQLGDGTTNDRTTPVQMSSLSEITAIAGGGGHTIALKSDGTVWTCGAYGWVDNGNGWTFYYRLLPEQVTGISGVVAIDAGWNHLVVLKPDGTVWTWGHNYNGQLGDGTTTDRNIPVQVDINLGEMTIPPMVVTSSASNITSNSATLNGTVNANGLNTTTWFEYGMTSGSYGSTSSTQTVSGWDDASVNMSISGLSAGTTYYFRIVAQNSIGTSYGSEMSFTTSTPPPLPTPTPAYTPISTLTPIPSPNPIITPPATPTPLPLEDGLRAYYPFNGNAIDKSSSGNHGTVSGATLTSDRFGNSCSAYEFDGVDDYIDIADDDTLDLTNSFTISVWIKQYGSQQQGYRIVDKATAGVNDGYNFDTYGCFGGGGNKMRLAGGMNNTCANTNYSLNEWHHLAVVFLNGMSTFYIDGVYDGTGNHGSNMEVNGLSLRIGYSHGALANKEYFLGVIDDVRIYNRALSKSEIHELYVETPTSMPVCLEALYSFDEGSGAIANDSSGNGNHGVINGAVRTTGISGGALSLDGINDYVDLGNPASLQPGTVSLSVWFKTTATGGRIVRKRTYGYGLNVLPSGKISFWINNAAAASFAAVSPDAYHDDTWHHAVGVYDGSTVKLYIDGSLVATADAGMIFYGAGAIAIGRDGDYPGSYFKGLVDDVRIFRGELSAPEVLDLYKKSSSGLVSHWKFDEGSGAGVKDSAGSNDGTISGATWMPGISGGGLSFDGVDDYVDLGSPSSLQPGMLSLSVWFKTGTGKGMILRKRLYGYGLEMTSSGAVSFWIYNADAKKFKATTPNVYNDDTWHHATGVYDGATVKLYVDGSQVATASAGAIHYGTGGIAIGRDGGYSGSYFKGLVDDVRIYNKALSEQDVLGLYNASLSSNTTVLNDSAINSNYSKDYTNFTQEVEVTPVPPSITLRSFKARAGADGCIILMWETSGEDNVAGFNLYRSRRRNGTYIQVNNAPINANGDAVSGAIYSFVDIPPGQGTYYYKLESVDYNGVSTMHGSEKMRVRSGDNQKRRSRRMRP